MDISVIVVLVLGLAVIVGGPVVGHYATKVSEKAEMEETNKNKSK